jgi:hypothetical protein
LTLDESWFDLSTDYALACPQKGEAPPETENHMIQAKKRIVITVWNPLGFHVVNALPKTQILNATYDIEHILQPIVRIHRESEEATFIHADNARRHIARQSEIFCENNSFRRTSHPPHSSDLAPSDFFVFGDMERCLKGRGALSKFARQSRSKTPEQIWEVNILKCCF